MSDEEKEVQKPGDETPVTPASGDASEEDEKKDEVTLSKTEFEALQKKAKDFDGMVEKKRLEKLNKREQPATPEGQEAPDFAEIARREAQRVLDEANRPIFEDNLKEAYADLIKEHPWANSDDVMAVVSERFKPEGHITKSHLLARLKNALETSYPDKYEHQREANIRKKIMADQSNIDAGDGGGDGGERKDTEKAAPLSEEAQKFYDAMGVPPEKRK